MTNTKQMKFVTAMKDFFGSRPSWAVPEGSTPLVDFMNELKALTDKDRADFTKWLATVGYEIVP